MTYKIELAGQVRVLTPWSHYYLLQGTVVEESQFKDSGLIEFTNEQLSMAHQPPQTVESMLKAKHRVHFYWRELQGVSIYETKDNTSLNH